MNLQPILDTAKTLLHAEARSIDAVADQLDANFVAATQILVACPNTIMTTGSGTSGTIARRMAHLLATCGMPAFSYILPMLCTGRRQQWRPVMC